MFSASHLESESGEGKGLDKSRAARHSGEQTFCMGHKVKG